MNKRYSEIYLTERVFIMKNLKQTSISSQILTSSQSRTPALKSPTSGLRVRSGIRAGRIGVGGGVGVGYHGVGVGERGPGWRGW